MGNITPDGKENQRWEPFLSKRSSSSVSLSPSLSELVVPVKRRAGGVETTPMTFEKPECERIPTEGAVQRKPPV